MAHNQTSLDARMVIDMSIVGIMLYCSTRIYRLNRCYRVLYNRNKEQKIVKEIINIVVTGALY